MAKIEILSVADRSKLFAKIFELAQAIGRLDLIYSSSKIKRAKFFAKYLCESPRIIKQAFPR